MCVILSKKGLVGDCTVQRATICLKKDVCRSNSSALDDLSLMFEKEPIENNICFTDAETLDDDECQSSFFILLRNIFRSHNPSTKPLTNSSKSIRTSPKLHLEYVMPLGIFLLHIPNCLHTRILWCTQWTFHSLYCLLFTFAIRWRYVQTTLVETMFAEEMNCWKVEGYAAGRTARCVEG